MFLGTGSVVLLSFLKAMFPGFLCLFSWCTDKHSIIFILSQKHLISPLQRRPPILGDTRPPVFVGSPASVLSPYFDFVRVFTSTVTKIIICSDFCILIGTVQFSKGGLTTRFDPPPNGLRELKLHRSSTNVCTKTKMFLKIFFDIRFRSEGT